MIEKATWNATTKEQFCEDYHYYVGYNIAMYGEDVWIVSTERFINEYPRWCPVWKVDVNLLLRRAQ